ncbi:hypothetical protein K456DRAFT_38010 [Colletotrichum gloeosporioides 23]|nr:hypothetical protein K456DRAFT_38010 [Colletotrichum gloeosporioides 23]
MGVRRGSIVQAAWSSCLEVTEIICTVTGGGRDFYGVAVEIREPLVWDWLDTRQLLWVFEDEDCVKVWQESVERPRPSHAAWMSRLQCIVGCCETDDGTSLYAVEWDGYACPTWEAEEDLSNQGQLLADHDQTCKCKPGRESRRRESEWEGRDRRKMRETMGLVDWVQIRCLRLIDTGVLFPLLLQSRECGVKWTVVESSSNGAGVADLDLT